MKIFITIITITIIFMQNMAVLAQEVTPSISPEPTINLPTPTTIIPPTPTPTIEPLENITPTPENIGFNQLEENQLFPDDPIIDGSAALKPLPQVRKLTKNTFRGEENIKVEVVDDEKPEDIKVELVDLEGNVLTTDIEKAQNGNRTFIKVIPPPQLKPGRYTLKITDSNGKTSEQDFNWGVLAINTNQSIYAPGDTAKLHMAVLDERGEMVCDADVRLDITDPEGKVTTHTTGESSIKVNPACFTKELTIEPDYEARFSTTTPGVYMMDLTAVTENGEYSITSTFEVREDIPYNIARTTATRIYPANSYPVLLSVAAVEDFKGTISEIVPENFEITELENTTPYKIVTTFDALSARKSITDASDLSLVAPFVGEFPVSQRFGEEEQDPLMAAKYEEFGVIGHDGVDYAVPEGTEVVSVDDGNVLLATGDGGYGTTIVVQHSWGRSYYGHLSEIEKPKGSSVKKGEVLGLSGNTGLSTGPHLHYGIKLNNHDINNGYYGKVNPLQYIPLETGKKIEYKPFKQSNFKVKVITWDVSLKKGETLNIGYRYDAPNISPQFYTLGPARFIDKNNQVVFAESRFWQIAVDADGSGTNTVSPNTGSPSATGNTYVFTFTPTELMDSGAIQIQVPSSGSPDWSTPQGSVGTAGYTTAVGNTAATVATVLNSNDAATNWAVTGGTTGDFCETAAGLDNTVFKEGTGSIVCTDPDTDSDSGDAIRYDYGTGQDWSSYTEVGYWIRVSATEASPNASFAWNNDADLHSTIIGESAVPALTADTWQYVKVTLSGTLTSIRSYGIRCTSNTCSLSDGNSFYIDEILIGPNGPTFSGRNINVRLLDATSTDTVTVTYGSGGGTSGVTNSSTEGAHTFTTLSKIAVDGTLTSISSSPTITLTAGPTNSQIMRHGSWFNSGEQNFYLTF